MFILNVFLHVLRFPSFPFSFLHMNVYCVLHYEHVLLYAFIFVLHADRYFQTASYMFPHAREISAYFFSLFISLPSSLRFLSFFLPLSFSLFIYLSSSILSFPFPKFSVSIIILYYRFYRI
uniref:Uncharacterized protein n=1 Tax=Cacopsylla melanoneura TaxID=428564 RepID=A0A8D9FJ33_9HEMI